MPSKYAPLTDFLKRRGEGHVAMTFSEIEVVLGFDLPPSSRRHRAWWSNNGSNSVMTRAWLDAGYQSRKVDIEGERLVFERLNAVDEDERRTSADHPLWGAMKGTVTIAPGVDLTEPLWDMEATEQSLDELARMLSEGAG